MMIWLILIYTTFGYPAAPKYYVTPISNVYGYVFSYEYVVKLVEYTQVCLVLLLRVYCYSWQS
jgi:hypothetical protein